jgi:RNA polymerase sigma factor (sigma-70 family)
VSGRSRRSAERARLPRAAAERFIERHGDAVLATANRYSVSREDAEDAFQRGLEILLTKAPDLPDDELLPWLKTVVKHEAFALWRGRDRVHPVEADGLERAGSAAPPPDEHVQSYERLAIGAEAIARLKPQEVRCLLLRADGLSYKQICEVTGWTYTKVNRCLTEGRQRFLAAVAGIESGAECDRLAPLLSALADGEATADHMAELRPHLRSCLACRGALRTFRDVPHRAAELVPPLAGAAHVDGLPGTISAWVDWAVRWVQERVATIGARIGTATEAASASKIAALAASTAALAGGAAALRAEDPASADGGAGGHAPAPLLEADLSPATPGLDRPKPPAAVATAPPAARPLGETDEGSPPAVVPHPPAAEMEVAAAAPPDPAQAPETGGYGGDPPNYDTIADTSRDRPPSEAGASDYQLEPLVVPWQPPGEQPSEEEPEPEEPPAEPEGEPVPAPEESAP